MMPQQFATEGLQEMMPEERLDRLERITKLMVKAGLRARQQMRLKNEERFGKLVEAQTRLIDPQTHTDQRLDALIDIIQKGRNGKSSS